MTNDAREKPEHTTASVPDAIQTWADAYLRAKRVEGLSAFTLTYYQQQLGHFFAYASSHGIDCMPHITPAIVREYLEWLEQQGHNAGGVHGAYRVLRAFCYWYEGEAEPAEWRNPFARVPAPRQSEEPIEPVSLADVDKLLRACGVDWHGLRDKAIILCLLDTGVRARELTALNRKDIDLVTGEITVRKGKGGKGRTVFLEKRSRKAYRAYLNQRGDGGPAAFVSEDGERLGYSGLRAVLVRRAELAGVQAPSPHDFRRCFAITMLRNGCDLITLSRLMGHRSLEVLRRYLKQVNEDLQAAHHAGSPVERMKGNKKQ